MKKHHIHASGNIKVLFLSFLLSTGKERDYNEKLVEVRSMIYQCDPILSIYQGLKFATNHTFTNRVFSES